MTYRPLVCVLGPFALVAACGGAGEATPAPATPSGPSASAGRPPGAGAYQPGPDEWARWTHDDKLAWMQKTVSPKMHDLFVAVDTPRYGDMSCKTCHGQGAIEGSFAMPNPELPKLDPDKLAVPGICVA